MEEALVPFLIDVVRPAGPLVVGAVIEAAEREARILSRSFVDLVEAAKNLDLSRQRFREAAVRTATRGLVRGGKELPDLLKAFLLLQDEQQERNREPVFP
jgi:hypothetical protein